MRCRSSSSLAGVLAAAASCTLHAQAPDMQLILQRLDRLEAQNQQLMEEIRALRQQVGAISPATAPGAPAPPPDQGSIEEQVQVAHQQISQLDQEKISTEHKLPLTLTGMLLFNTFYTGKGGGGADNPTLAASPGAPLLASAGATLRQTVVGVRFDGPQIAGGGKITGSAYIDFFGGSGATLNQLLRLRVASVDAAWANTTLTFALDKPIIAPREPDSLAQVGVSPLTAAGNLWLWQPQIRAEQRFKLGSHSGVRAQIGVYETSEGGTGLTSEYASSLSKDRPGLEGRFEFWTEQGESRRIEIAPGFHASETHVAGQSVPSRIFTIDWLIRPASRVDFTGTFFQGENAGVVGGLRQGVSVVYENHARPVHATGGWAQVTYRASQRLAFHVYGGQEDDRNSDLNASGAIAKNQAYAGNAMYRFGSNVLGSFEVSGVRTTFLGSGTRWFPHYDLGLAYLF